MDLDFSFTLVSSLTPRSQTTRTPLVDNNKLTTKLLKAKQTQSVPPKPRSSKLPQHKEKEEKENFLPKEQQMIKNEHLRPKIECNSNNNGSSGENTFFIDMANVAVRKNRIRDQRKAKSSPPQTVNNRSSSSSSTVEVQHEKSNKISPDRTLSPAKKIINPKSEVKDLCNENSNSFCGDSHVSKTCVSRKSPRLNRLSDQHSLSARSSLDIIESSSSELKNVSTSTNDSFCKDKHSTKQNTKRVSPRISGISEASISTAYDSDSFETRRRRPVKVIPETPETDESVRSKLRGKRKSSEESISVKKIKDSFNNGYSDENENTKVVTRGYISKSISPEDSKVANTVSKTETTGDEHRKKLRSSKEIPLTDTFMLESSIKKQVPTGVGKKEITDKKEKTDDICALKDKRKPSISPVLKELNTKLNSKKNNDVKEKKQTNKEKARGKIKSEVQEENICEKLIENHTGKQDKQKVSNKYFKTSPLSSTSPKSTLVPPTEIIPKLEHINNWLKGTHEKSIDLICSDSSFDKPKKALKPTGRKPKISLSPRIETKLKIAQSTLQDEQKLFEDLYGDALVKRLSDEVDEVASIASSGESVELSEKVLEKLYGTVWQKDAVLPQSEPRKGKKSQPKKTDPRSERKKQRTSIYEVFSSSSSEDRFEEFLESVRRGKLKTTRRRSGRPGTPEFINDSDSGSEPDLAFYQNIVSSAVKEDVDKLRHKDTESPTRVNRRRLSFGSSKDGGSESGKPDVKPPAIGKKTTKPDIKETKRKPRSKKKTDKDVEEKNLDLNGFTLVTPIKIDDKKTGDNLSTRIKNVIDSQVPKSISKSKTPKNTVRDDNPTTEEKLKEKYLSKDNFKVPKNFSLLTPTNPIKRNVPPSPALSFLSSLSDMTGGLPCHPDALVYKKDFKNRREELTKKLFNLYNNEVFENKLAADMLIQWNIRMTSTSGFCYNKRVYRNNQMFRSARIVLSTKILDRADRLRDTLIHELCHAATWIVNGTSDGHGPNWKAWARRANQRFPELPVIKRCHDYAISTKFTYKCMSCGYCIGRHSKSLDTERKRCGYCYGKFQLFVTAKMSAASATSGSDSVKTPRNPNGFALFVKENYAIIKKENNVPHGQVMKLLSQKFAEVKISKQNANEIVIN